MFYAWSSRNLVKKAMPNWCQPGLLKEIRERRAWKAIACAFGAGYVREKIVKSVGRERNMGKWNTQLGKFPYTLQ